MKKRLKDTKATKKFLNFFDPYPAGSMWKNSQAPIDNGNDNHSQLAESLWKNSQAIDNENHSQLAEFVKKFTSLNDNDNHYQSLS